MSTMRESKRTLTRDELMAAVRRTQDEMTATADDLDPGEIATIALRAYWDRERAKAGFPTAEQIEAQTAQGYRRLALTLESSAEGSGFWQDVVAATLPIFLVVLIGALSARLNAPLPSFVPTFAIALAVLASVLLYVRTHRVDRIALTAAFQEVRLPGFYRSMGALAGGLLIAAAVGAWFQASQSQLNSMGLALTEKHIADFGVQSLIAARVDGEFLRAPTEPVSLPSTRKFLLTYSRPELNPRSPKGDRVRYLANVLGIEGELELDLNRAGGLLAWRHDDLEVRDRFVVGSVVLHEADKVEILVEGGQRLKLSVKGQPIRQLKAKTCVAAGYNEATGEVKAIEPFRCVEENTAAGS